MRFLRLQTLSDRLTEIQVHERPRRGWIYALRTSLGMTAAQLAARIGVKQQTLSRLEAREVDDSVTLKNLRRTAEAMGCKLVYAFVPHRGTLEDLVRQRALQKAKEIFASVDHSMALEDQRVDSDKEAVSRLAENLAQQLKSSLWD